MHSREWLAPKEVASELNLHPGTVYRLIAAGRIPAARPGGPGGALRVPRQALDDLVHNSKEPTP